MEWIFSEDFVKIPYTEFFELSESVRHPVRAFETITHFLFLQVISISTRLIDNILDVVKSDDSVICPHCGESIRRDALSCRHCGSDDLTGWSHDTDYDGVDLPEEGDYEEVLEREGFLKPKSGGRKWLMAGISTILVFLFAAWLFRGLWQG